MKIVIYGNCSYPFFYREVIRQAKEEGSALDWHILIYSWRHLPLIEGLLPQDHIFYVPDDIGRRMKLPMASLDILKNYYGSIIRDITADKNIPGQLRRYPKEHQLHSAVAYYQLYKDYLMREKPDAVLCTIIESHEGMMLYAAAKELKIQTIFVTSSRNLALSFFSETPNEEMPAYTFNEPLDPSLMAKAEDIVHSFQKSVSKAVQFTYEPRLEDLIEFKKFLPVTKKLMRAPRGLWNLYQDVKREPYSYHPNPLWFQPFMQFWWLNLKVATWKAKRRKRFADITHLDQLPKKFVYFPLHVYPELTITTMAPFFEDQLRAVDLIRYHIPPDHLLVIKEHPAMLGRRPLSFFKALTHRAGVYLAAQQLPSVELIKRSSMTVSITGTACLEAMLLGKPSLTLEKTFFSHWVPVFDSFHHFHQELANELNHSAEEIKKRAIDCVAHTLQIGYDFMLWDPYNPDVDPKYTMNRRNVKQFIHAFEDHLRRSRAN